MSTPHRRGNQHRPAESIDPVAAIDVHVGVGTEHHDIQIGIGSRRASGMTAYEGHRAHVLAGFREGQHGRKEPLDVLGKTGAHDNIIARGFSFEARRRSADEPAGVLSGRGEAAEWSPGGRGYRRPYPRRQQHWS